MTGYTVLSGTGGPGEVVGSSGVVLVTTEFDGFSGGNPGSVGGDSLFGGTPGDVGTDMINGGTP